jgi:dipeptidyl aminopeptidase/acylaminoacyl peptidase
MRTAALLSIMVGALLGVGCERLSVPPEGDASELIVYTTLRPPNQDIFLVDGPDAEPRRLTDHWALDYNAAFSPDGRWLVFTSDRGGNTDLYALDVQDGREPVRLTRDSAMDDAADVSPDGNRIVFVSTRDSNADVFVMPFAPGDTTIEARAENLTRRRGGDFNPSFSPDGSLIAWARQEARPPDGPVFSPQNFRRAQATEVFVMASDGSGARPIGQENLFGDEVRVQMVGGSPAWSPDGTSIYFHGFAVREQEFLAHMRDRSTRTGIWRTPLSGGSPEQVVGTEATFALSPSVVPGGRIAYATGPAAPPGPAPLLWHRSGEVHSVGAHSGNARVEVDSSDVPLCLAPAFHRDGRLACHGPGPTSGMSQMSNRRPLPRPGTERVVQLEDRSVRLLGIRGIFPDFLPDDRIVYGEWLNEATALGRFARDGLPPVVTSELNGKNRQEVFRHKKSHS